MATYNDIVHGPQVELSRFEYALSESPAILQLSTKKQLGLTHRIYSNATHTRREHSIGTMIGAGKVASTLRFSAHNKKLLQAAAALHDIGHYPLSHAAEEKIAIPHEEISAIVLAGEDFGAIDSANLCSLLEKNGVAPTEVRSVLQGRHELSPLISGKVIDVDRLDYLARDLIMCNVDFSSDIHKIIHELRFDGGYSGITKKGLSSVIMFFVSRALAFDQIYRHPKTLVAETMLQYAVARHPEFSQQTSEIAQQIHRMGDEEFLNALCSGEESAKLVKLLKSSKDSWYKVVASVGGEAGLEPAKILYANKESIKDACEITDLLYTFDRTEKILSRGENFPKFPVYENDEVSDLFDRKLARATYDHIPERLFEIYGPTGSDEEKKLANNIVQMYSK